MVNNDFLMGYGAGKAAGGGGPTLITKTITANGTYAASSDSADGFSSVTVDVASKDYDANDWLNKTKPTGVVTTDATGKPAPMYYRTGITGIRLPNCTAILDGSFAYNCTACKVLFAPQALVSSSCVSGSGIETVVIKRCDNYIASALAGATSLKVADIVGTYTSGNWFGTQRIFSGDTQMDTLIVRSTDLVPIGQLNHFDNTPFASGGAGGILYVPSALISSYQAATNWSTILGYANNQILPIEGSIYETQYADGTPIS